MVRYSRIKLLVAVAFICYLFLGSSISVNAEEKSGYWGTSRWTFETETGSFTLGGGELGTRAEAPWAADIDEIALRDIASITITDKLILNVISTNVFADLGRVSFYNFELIDTSKVINGAGMFRNTSLQESIDFSTFDTKKMTNMSGMFEKFSCQSIKGVSTFDTSNVTDMSYMFSEVSIYGKTVIDVSNFDTSNVTNMSHMFNESSYNLLFSGISNWDVSKVRYFRLFAKKGCATDTAVDLSNWDVSSAIDMGNMFDNTRMAFLDSSFTNWNVGNVEQMGNMFAGTSVSKLKLGSWDTGKVINMNLMFNNTNKLEEVDVSGWNVENVRSVNSMFENSLVSKLNTSNWDTGKMENMHAMFRNTNKLAELDVSGWNVGNVENMANMFDRSSVRKLATSSWDTGKVISMSFMFNNAKQLAEVDVSGWNVGNVTHMNNMFTSTAVSKLKTSNWDTSKVTTMANMFTNADKLVELDVSGWNVGNVRSMSYTFEGTSISKLNVANWDTGALVNAERAFAFTPVTELDVSNWNVSKLSMANGLFWRVPVVELDVSNWNTKALTDMGGMFLQTKVSELDFSNWDTSNVTNMISAIREIPNLEELDLSSFSFKSIGRDPNSGRKYVDYMLYQTPIRKLTLKEPIPDFYNVYLNDIDFSTGVNSGRWIGISSTNLDKLYASSMDLMTNYSLDYQGTFVWEKSHAELTVKDTTITTLDTWTPADNLVLAKNAIGETIGVDKMVVSGAVDTKKAGEYLITYEIDGISKKAKVTVKDVPANVTIQFVNEENILLEEYEMTLKNYKVWDELNLPEIKQIENQVSTLAELGYEVYTPAGAEAVILKQPETTITYQVKGRIFILSMPTEIDFGSVKYQGKKTRINSAEHHGADLVVKDSRANKNGWTLTAKLTTPMTSTDPSIPAYTLTDALKYVYEGNEITLNAGAQDIMIQSADSSANITTYNISDTWSASGDGFKFETAAQDVKAVGTYQGEILWELGATP